MDVGLTTVLNEYKHFARGKARDLDQQYIARFDPTPFLKHAAQNGLNPRSPAFLTPPPSDSTDDGNEDFSLPDASLTIQRRASVTSVVRLPYGSSIGSSGPPVLQQATDRLAGRTESESAIADHPTETIDSAIFNATVEETGIASEKKLYQ